jgi:DNA repair exonuclease SbcCD ATPase subunit
VIKSLNVENFQSHKKSKLEFSAGVNALTGTSDAGKSGLFRAMVWVLTNRPRGEAFRSDWGGFTHVSIVTDSYFIGRGRDGKENAYELRNDEEDIDLYFKAIKGDVPDEVAQALNISSINIQSQHQPHFLLSDTPGKVAEHFSSVANLSQISSTIKWIQKGLRRVTTEEETYTTREGELKDSLKEFEQLEEFEKLVTRFEELELKKQQILTDTEKLSISNLLTD